jgi:7-keto-8-aminopelargonate synthetase-like enzyme
MLNVDALKQIYSGTDYLGTANDPYFLEKVKDSVETFGLHYGGSRWANNCPGIYDEAEKYLAGYFGVEDAILCSSGSMAAYFAQQIIHQQEGELYCSEDLHPAMRTVADDVIILENEYLNWPEIINEHNGPLKLVFNAINPSTVQQFKHGLLEDLPDQWQHLLVLDDSHGIGLIGPEGRGALSLLNKTANIECLVAASLGKSFGLPGGILLGKQSSLNGIRSLPKWGGSSPPSPFVAKLMLEEMAYFDSRRTRLRGNLDTFLNNIDHPHKFQWIPDFPVFLVREAGLYDHLLEHQIVISAFPYPDPAADRIERVVVNASKSEKQIKLLTELINQFQ